MGDVHVDGDVVVAADGDTRHFTNARGEQLFCRTWSLPDPEKVPRAIVFMSHGFSEHLGLYHLLGNAFQAHDIVLFGHDHVGHGRSDGKRVYVESVDQYVDDLFLHCKDMQRSYPHSPLFAIGHSMGGMIVLRACLNHATLFKGVILQGPLVIPGPPLGPFDARVNFWTYLPTSLFLGALDVINPEMVLGQGVLSLVTGDEEMKTMLRKDALRWMGGVKVRLLLAFLDCLEDNLSLLHEMETPFLALHGSKDWLCNPKGSRMLFDSAVAVEDKEIHVFDGAAHQLYLERKEIRDDAIRRTVEWVMNRASDSYYNHCNS